MLTKLDLEVVKAFRIRAGGLVCAALLAALAGASPSMAQPGAASKALAAPADDHPTAAVSGPQAATPLSGVEVVVKPKVTPLSGLVVTAPRTCLPPRSPADTEAPSPKLVSTYPADGQTVSPGYLVLRLTFDVPMACRGSLPQVLLAACYSEGIETWHESADKRSLLILCNLKPNTQYKVSINVRIPEHFTALSGLEADGGGLSFQTSQAPPVITEAALIDRDPQLAAVLSAAGPGRSARNPAAAEADDAGAPEVSRVLVTPATTCLQPRDPPDKDVPAPKLVSTFPAAGQTVPPGLLELRFTFDLPMACTAGVTISGGKGDPCTDSTTSKPTLIQHWFETWDRRTLRLLCRVEPGERYRITMNKAVPGEKDPWPDFKGLGGGKAGPYELTFATSNAAPLQTQEKADDEDPMMAALVGGQAADRTQ